MNSQIISGLLTAGIGYPIVAAVAYFAGKVMGYRLALEQQAAASEQAEKDREKIEEDVAKRSDEQLDKELGKWFRD